MKKITLIIISFCLVALMFADNVEEKEYYPLTKAELQILAVKVDSLQQANKIKDDLIIQYNFQIKNLMALSQTDSMLISYKEQQIKALYDINKLQKPSWWEKYDQWLYYGFGAGSILLGSWVVSNVVGG